MRCLRCEHCTLRDNRQGISIADASAPTFAVNNLIQNNAQGGIVFSNCSNASVSNQTITGHAANYGALCFVNSDGFRVGAGNTITGNNWAVSMDVSSSPDPTCDGNIPLTGNTNNDGIRVIASNTRQAEAWPDLSPAAYVVIGASTIHAEGSLTIDPGCTVEFDNAASFTVYGTLNIPGTAGSGVLLTRRDAGESWHGLQFAGAGSNGALSYCTIEHAASYTSTAAIAATGGAVPVVQHCTLRDNRHGISVTDAPAPTFAVNNLIQNNTQGGIVFSNCPNASVSNQTITGHAANNGAIYFASSDGFRVGAGNTITGNNWAVSMDLASSPDPSCDGNIPITGNTNNDGIRVVASNTRQAETWPDLSPAAYVCTGASTIHAEGALTIDPGCTVKFDNAASFTVYGTLNIPGTAGSGVLLTRRDAGESWHGLQFSGASAGGTLSYCTIEYVASYTSSAAVSIDGAGELTLAACTLRNGTTGLRASNASPHVVNTRIIDNTQYGVYLDGASVPNFGNSLTEWNDIHGNAPAIAGRDLRNGTADIAARYVYWGTVVAAEIENRIHHEPDDATRGTVYFGPWTNSDHDTPYGGAIAVDDAVLPQAFALHQNCPNPFNPATVIAYALPRAGHVRLEVFDVAGRRVETLLDEDQSPGFKTLRWEPSDLPSGIYIYRLNVGDFSQTRRMMLVR